MKKLIFLLFAALHFFVILYSNIIGEEQTLTYYFKQKQEAGKAYSLLDKYPRLLEAYGLYAHFTGTETGYGFYAPSVANQVIFMFTIRDKNNMPIATDQISFHNREAYMRSLCIGNAYLKRPPQKDSFQNKSLNAVIKSMALWVLDTHPGARSIDADLLVYNVATSFTAIKRNKKATYVKMEHYAYSL